MYLCSKIDLCNERPTKGGVDQFGFGEDHKVHQRTTIEEIIVSTLIFEAKCLADEANEGEEKRSMTDEW